MGLATSVRVGTVIGDDFEVKRRLGEGGMGVVFLTSQRTTGRQRALKVMHSGFVLDAKARARFEQEARIGARIQSDHVVQVVAAGIEEKSQTPWIAMELLKGQDLERHIATQGPMRWEDAAIVVGQVGHALAAAHDVHVVHRDIKPENIFLSASRVVGVPFMVKVLDFGIAKLRSAGRSATLAVGTPAYMAPEQTRSSDNVSAASDVWALGLVVFRMLTGGYFWRAASNDDPMPVLWRELLIDPISSASERAAEMGREETIPAGFDQWLARCLERDPEERYPHAREAVLELQTILAASITASRSESAHRSGSRWTAAAEEALADPLASTGRADGWQEAGTQSASAQSASARSASHSNDPTLLSDPNGTPLHRVTFREDGERVVSLATEGVTLLDASLAAGIPHYHACGGKARCSTCRVVVSQGRDNLGPRTAAEEAVASRRGWPDSTRLACQATVRGPCVVRRLVMGRGDASVVDLRRTGKVTETQSHVVTCLALRFDGIDTVLADGFPDDAIHVLERCVAPIAELAADNGGHIAGFEGTTVVVTFPDGEDGLRRAVRVGLRAVARIRQLNPYLLKHFGAQVDTAVGIGAGTLVDGHAGGEERGGRILIGNSVRAARESLRFASRGQVVASAALVAGLDVVTSELAEGFAEVVDFDKSDVVFLVQTSFDRLRSKAADFSEAFYSELFTSHPAAAPMFEHTDMDEQQRMLFDTLDFAVRGLDDFSKIETAVRELGARHVEYGVSRDDYRHVGRALVRTLEQHLAEDFTPEVELAWREIYSALARAMIDAA